MALACKGRLTPKIWKQKKINAAWEENYKEDENDLGTRKSRYSVSKK